MAAQRIKVSLLTALVIITGLVFVSETEAGRRDDGKRRYEKNGRNGPNKTVVVEKNRGRIQKKTVVERSHRSGNVLEKRTTARNQSNGRRSANKTVIIEKDRGRVQKKTVVKRSPRTGQVLKKTTTVNYHSPGRKSVVKKRRQNHRVVKSAGHYRPIKVRGKSYYHRKGRFYRRTSKGYINITAPIGAIIMDLPIGFARLFIDGHYYYRYEGIYYRRHNHGYRVVRPPIGVRLSVLPYDAEIVRLHNGYYYGYDGTYYRRVGNYYEVCEGPTVVSSVEPRSYHTVMVENSNGSQSPVELEHLGHNEWKGPRGEIYRGWPSEEQLRDAYGF